MSIAGSTYLGGSLQLQNQTIYVHNNGDTNHYIYYNGGIDGVHIQGYGGVSLNWRGGTLLATVSGPILVGHISIRKPIGSSHILGLIVSLVGAVNGRHNGREHSATNEDWDDGTGNHG